MKKFLLGSFISLLCLSNLVVFGVTSNADLNQKIEILSNELSGFKGEYKNTIQLYKDISDLSSNIIDKGLDRQSAILTVFTIVFTIIFGILGLLLGLFMNKKYNQTIEAKQNSDSILNEVKELKGWINNNEKLLYEKMQNAETEYIFNRLEEWPEDISNFFTHLATRKLNLKYFKKLEQLFDTSDVNRKFKFIQLIFQHFPDKLILVDSTEIRNYFRDYNERIISLAFSKEIEKSLFVMADIVIKIKQDIYINRYSEYLQELNNQKRLEKNNYRLLNLIYENFLNHKEELLFQEICDNISLDYQSILNGGI